MEVRIALTNLGRYNEGKLIYKWLDMPCDKEELEKAFREIGINEEYEEFFITDYEAPFEIGEYDSIETINKKIEAYEEALEKVGDEDALEALMEEYDLDEIMCYEYYIHYGVSDMSDVAYNYVHDNYNVDDMPFGNYIDYVALGRDMGYEGTYIFYSDKDNNDNAIEIIY